MQQFATRLHRHLLWCGAVGTASLAVTSAASAQYLQLPDDARRGSDDAREEERLRFGIRIGYGWLGLNRPEDKAGDPTLLFGTAFTGSGLQFGGVVGWRPATYFVLRTGFDLTSGSMVGFAETPAYRRELTFNLTSVEIPLAAEVPLQVGPIRISPRLGPVVRFAAAASAEEVRSEGSPNDPPLQIRTALSFGLVAALETAFTFGKYAVPLDFRYMMNLSNPSSTVDRFENGAAANPGAYLVDNDWSFSVSVGFDFLLPRRETPPPPFVPPPPLVPMAPVMVAAAPIGPDQDGDGVPDALDACPIEPSSPTEPGEYAGCPASGGIVRLSCDTLFVSAPIEFQTNSANILDESMAVLYLIADTLYVAPNVLLLSIEGHTDDRGSSSANQQLSQRRAEAVMDFLIEVGIEPSRLEAVGYGPSYPVADNGSEEGRRANRRVAFVILENSTCR